MRYAYLLIACFLFMGDMLLLAENTENLHLILNATNDFLCKWKLRVIKGQRRFMIGNKVIEISQSYKYLGEVITADPKLEPHTTPKRKGKINKWSNKNVHFNIIR